MLVPALVVMSAGSTFAWFATMPVIAVVDVPVEVPRAVPVPVPVPLPIAIAGPRAALRVDGRIEHVAASANADVIAFATRDRVWVSRDGGASFEPALDGKGEISELFVDVGGAVYAKRPDALGMDVPGLPARWLPLPALDGRLLDAEGGVFLGEAWDQGAVMDATDGLAWITLLEGSQWNVIAGKVITAGDARLITSQRLGEHHWSAPELHLAGTSGDTVVWRGTYDDSVGFLRSSTPCAALVANDRTWIVQRDSNPDPDRPAHAAQLLAIDDQGKASPVPIDLDLDADRVTCSIVGNDHATYGSFSVDGGAPRLYALSFRSRDAIYLGGDPIDLRAVDRAGRALGLRDGDLVRRADDGTFEVLARGR